MSMGTSACFAEVISEDNIKKILGKKSRKLTSFINLFNKLEEDEGASSLIEYLEDGNLNAISDPDDKDIKRLNTLWTEIRDTVMLNTSMELVVSYHDKDSEGDGYDEVEGLYFEFPHGDLYQPTPEYTRLKERFGDEVVKRCFYTVWG